MFDFVKWPLAAAMLMGTLAAAPSAMARDGDRDGRIGHVFVIVLENEGFDTTFGTTAQQNPATQYLSQTLPGQGVLLSQYYGTGHVSLDNYIAMISGQSSTVQTHVDCTFYDDFKLTGVDPNGNQAIGTGCVYPAQFKTLADQLTAARLTWRGYMEDMGLNPKREQTTCGQPLDPQGKAALNELDDTQGAEKTPGGDQYAARHNPFVYFHSLIDSGECAKNVVNFNQLAQDLLHESTTPNFVFITPNLCHDGHDGGPGLVNGQPAPQTPCKNGEVTDGVHFGGGLIGANAFLKATVPLILNSPAFKEDGLLIVTFDEGGLSGTTVKIGGTTFGAITNQGTSCCGQQPGPNIGPLVANGQPLTLGFENANGSPPNFFISTPGFGGDRIGAVLVSPFLKAGATSNVPYNHYSMLKSVEDIFGLDHLGYAGQPGLQGFFVCTNSDIGIGADDQSARCGRD
jgi:phosphatidylinositol-3-phosphatase